MPKLRITEILLLLYVVFIPLEAIIVIESLGTLSRLIGYFLVISFVSEYKIIWKVVSKEAYFFVSFLLLSYLWAMHREAEQALKIIMYFFFIIIIVNTLRRNIRILDLIVNLFSISTFFVAITSFFGFVITEDRFGSISAMGVAPLSLLFAVGYAFQLTKIELGKASLLNYILLVGNLLGAIATGTRASWLAVLIISAIYISWQQKFSRLLKRITVVFTVFFIFLMYVPAIQDFIESRLYSLTYDEGANRTIIWNVAWEMWKDKPLFGFGYRNFPANFTFDYINRANISYSEFDRLTYSGTGGDKRGSHNDYIGIVVELGIFGLILFLFWIKRLLKKIKYISPYYYGFLALLIMSFFQDNINQKIFWLLFGLMEFFKATNRNNINPHGLIYKSI